MKEPRAVLVICVRYLGDTLLLRPPLRALRRAFPKARLDVVVAEGTAVALEGCKHADRIHEWPRSSLPAAIGLCARLATAGYDWAVDFTGNDRAALLALLSRAHRRIAYERPKSQRRSLRSLAFNDRHAPRKPKPHILVQRLELLGHCGVASAGWDCELKPDPARVRALRDQLKNLPARLVAIHPTSRDLRKAIPQDVLRGVVALLVAHGWGVLVTTGPAETERQHVRLALQSLPSDHTAVFSDLPWTDLIALFSLAAAFWGADSAPAHAASALGLPVRVEFGPSSADHWKPWQPDGCAAVHPCHCLDKKSRAVRCPPDTPGQCLHAVRPGDILAWLSSASREAGP